MAFFRSFWFFFSAILLSLLKLVCTQDIANFEGPPFFQSAVGSTSLFIRQSRSFPRKESRLVMSRFFDEFFYFRMRTPIATAILVLVAIIVIPCHCQRGAEDLMRRYPSLQSLLGKLGNPHSKPKSHTLPGDRHDCTLNPPTSTSPRRRFPFPSRRFISLATEEVFYFGNEKKKKK